ncbi:hypothetical protein DENIS_4583 [Desulfonema ishimotonii]|uniref:Replication protein A C-terminal domain-containing protein n=1 Tax=Desulfonema ishimotonii TaxID=45657 RepID=A0A401G391_9BACT|nr:hypothetical protein [Desulfonema ishimotonii]GBC63585.1 hypothetical protein DENIS_4583 [Desulfonema ishimotonii]
MAGKRKKSVTLNTLVRVFMRDYNIPTKKDVDRLMNRLDRLEFLLRKVAEAHPDRSRSGKDKAVGAGPGAASDLVLAVISEFRDGVGFSEIQKRTGFGEKKLRNIIFRLNKIGKIERISRGIYIVI